MRIPLSVSLALAALLFIACGSNSQKTESTPQPSMAGQPTDSVAPSTTLPTAAPTAAPTEQPALSSQKQIGDLLLTVNGASLYADDILPAAPGTHYVAIDVTTENTGDQSYILNVLNFRVKDSESLVHDPAMTGGPQPQVGSYDSMVPGQVIRGSIVFPLGDGSDPVELQYRSPTGITGTVPVPKPAP